MSCFWWVVIIDVGLFILLLVVTLIVLWGYKTKQLTREAYHTGHREKDLED